VNEFVLMSVRDIFFCFLVVKELVVTFNRYSGNWNAIEALAERKGYLNKMKL
jgi:hypothetical protein